ncbi:MAG: septum formation initiator family protein [Treponema sp.]|jgi:cell division protein FtsL|nr:septum formation initiator family protein [Treponema sp.]
MYKARIVLFYFLTATVPLLFGTLTWQSGRYAELEKETVNLEAVQEDCIAGNRRLIAGIALLSSAERIEKIARDQMGLAKKRPEEVLQIRITGGYGPDGK